MSETEEGKTRGRPRPEETKARDARVLEYLKAVPDGATRKALDEAFTDLTGAQVYLSLYRLRQDGAVEKQGSTWKAVPEPAVA